ncbi:hypothetical protein U9M48_041141 [Paspalum notatum var. saurae]|uniref:Zinc finger PHD-type domain-containing protein n=1 Tax=Paspalum notatum var. saurae TaxID=547442 RepID=A0AAQ3UN52_PASNO
MRWLGPTGPSPPQSFACVFPIAAQLPESLQSGDQRSSAAAGGVSFSSQRNRGTMMSDDDDGVEPQFEAVDKYHFVDTEDEPVCFSTLPFQFDENDKVEDCHCKQKVYLRGHTEMDKSHLVHKKVVAWRVRLDCEQPNISILSSEGNWIKLLNPWKPYKDMIARSILITIQMLHFVSKQQRDERSLWDCLWDHLNQVFDNLDTTPAMDDLIKHHPLIKLFLERDPAFMNLLEILHRFIGDTTKTTKKPRTLGTQVQLTGTDESHGRNNYTDSDYDDQDGNDDSDDDSNNGLDYDDDNDSYRGHDSSDVGTNNDNGTSALCALCDDGGNMLSCIGRCKRSFHPRKEDGIESACRTLGYTSAELEEMGDYLCENCKYNQHQCFKCGELEPSAEPNAKVFKCEDPACGYFYHPKCVAKLLEPDDPDVDGSCELAQRIMEGMPFTCPVHWCFKCRRMEDRTQRAMQLAACRRCPKSYHRECLPREISFETKNKNIKQRGWNLPGIVIIYCLDHEICEATGSAKRGHIKFPQTTKMIEISDLAEKKGQMVSAQKGSIGQCSAPSTKVLDSLTSEKSKHTQNSLDHMVLEPEGSATSLKEHLQIEPSMVGAATLNDQKALKGQKSPAGSSLRFAVGSERGKSDMLKNIPKVFKKSECKRKRRKRDDYDDPTDVDYNPNDDSEVQSSMDDYDDLTDVDYNMNDDSEVESLMRKTNVFLRNKRAKIPTACPMINFDSPSDSDEETPENPETDRSLTRETNQDQIGTIRESINPEQRSAMEDVNQEGIRQDDTKSIIQEPIKQEQQSAHEDAFFETTREDQGDVLNTSTTSQSKRVDAADKQLIRSPEEFDIVQLHPSPSELPHEPKHALTNPSVTTRLQEVIQLLQTPTETLVQDAAPIRQALVNIMPLLPESLQVSLGCVSHFEFYKALVTNACNRIATRQEQAQLKATIKARCTELAERKAAVKAKADTSTLEARLT